MSTVNLISQQPPTPVATIPGLYTDNPFTGEAFSTKFSYLKDVYGRHSAPKKSLEFCHGLEWPRDSSSGLGSSIRRSVED